MVLPSTLIRHEKGAFRKRSSNRRYLKTPAFLFSVDQKHFENDGLRKRPYDNYDIRPARVLLKHKSKIAGDSFVFNSSGVTWTETFDAFSE